MLTLYKPQVWAVITVLSTAVFGLIMFITTLLTRTISVQLTSFHDVQELTVRVHRTDEP